jgi:signal transduction histidine kinase
MRMSAADPMTDTKDRLVREVAGQAGLVLRNLALIGDLRESRRRIVAAQDVRARKLERDIHDGVQQHLVALAVKLKLADALVDRDPAAAHAAIAQLQTDANTALDDLRDLARGIYPPLLADRGLAAALEAQARRAPLPVTVDTDGTGRYPPEIEAAVYFCALEALNNVAKYADASHASVTLSRADGSLRFEVRDDGAGFDVEGTTHGTGLQGMADRLAAVGGTLDLESDPGAGTTVAGRVPVAGAPSG